MTEQATLKFGLREQAKDFCTAWTFFSKRGHLLGAGKENVTVILFDVTEKEKQWIDSYCERLNT